MTVPISRTGLAWTCLALLAAAPVAKNLSPEDGMINARPKVGQPWAGLKAGAEVPAEQLLLLMPGAKLASPSGQVELMAHGNLHGDSPLPVIETAVVLHPPGEAALDVTLDRGRIDLSNTSKAAATVNLRFRDAVWELTLEPGARAALEFYGRWIAGDQFKADADPKEHAPVAEALLIVVKGEAELHIGRHTWRMHAPPGPAVFAWHSETGPEAHPHKLETLPHWAKPETETSLQAKKLQSVLAKFRALQKDKSLEEAIQALLASQDPDESRVAIYSLAAMDQLALLGQVLRTSDNPELWDHAVVATRHWLGRQPGQDQKLYHHFIDKAGMTPVQAETVLHLLHDPGEVERQCPETYEFLIDALDHPVFVTRGLANWHLKRLVPAGRDIPYNPQAPEAERLAAVKAWKKLIPTGQLPKTVTP